jgi:peptidoglycan/xylan/chitin deacetylase (PgdA/CDA1 family)
VTAYRRSGGLPARLVRFAGDTLARRGSAGRRLCIVTYHRILEHFDPLQESEPDVATFRWQMKLLADCFNVLPLDDALAAMAAGSLPPRAVCITFDDGYRSTHDLALPILSGFDLPATVFVTSGYLGEGNMWNDKILEAVRHVPIGVLDLLQIGLGTREINTMVDRKNAIDTLTETAKYLPPLERLALTERLESLAGSAPAAGLMLTPETLRALTRHRIEIGAHTVSHPILTSLDADSARYEIEECKLRLEAITGSPVRFFAYPNGKTGTDFDDRHVAMVQAAGFSAAFSTAAGAATQADDRFQLPRSRPWDSTRLFYVLRLLRWLAP